MSSATSCWPRRNGVYATLPYFIPAPTLIGTFGAVIRIKSPIRSRQALFDIGIAGPIAGFLVALPVLFWGLALSKPMPAGAPNSALEFGYPLDLQPGAISCWRRSRRTPAPLGNLYLHPVGIAAWVGMFATALNLLPGGQFDGGHIIYAVAPRAHKWVTRASILVLHTAGHLLLARMAGLGGDPGIHRPAASQRSAVAPLDGNRRWLALLAVLMLVLTFALAPIRGYGLFGS